MKRRNRARGPQSWTYTRGPETLLEIAISVAGFRARRAKDADERGFHRAMIAKARSSLRELRDEGRTVVPSHVIEPGTDHPLPPDVDWLLTANSRTISAA